MVLRSRGEISDSSVFIRHCWSRVRKAWITSPLLSVTIVEYSIRSGRGKIQFSNRKSKKTPAMAINPLLREDLVNIRFVMLSNFFIFFLRNDFRVTGVYIRNFN